nr:PREDICTED: C-type lectin BfL-2-like [Stegastes partitus]
MYNTFIHTGGISLCSDVIREYHLINTAKSWNDAQSYCRANYTDLATIGNSKDMKTVVSKTAASGVTREIWIGLTETRASSWLWSVGETETSSGVVENTNWAPEKGSGEFPLLVVSEPKTWKEAQEYCRKNSKDLASVRSQAENLEIQEIFNDDDDDDDIKSVWIGLFKDKWTWSDQSGSSFRHWQSSQPNNDGDCAIYSPKSKSWYDRNCKYKWPFYCYNDPNQE